MGLIKQRVSPAKAAANRANSKNSQGPVTEPGKAISRLNAAKHWGRAEVLRELMPALGEHPAEFERLRHQLYRSLRPVDGFETLLVDDLADIQWRSRRMVKAEAANQGMERRKRLAEWEAKAAADEAGKLHDLEKYLCSKIGFAGLRDSLAKFDAVLEILKNLAQIVELEGFQGNRTAHLTAVYGTMNPSLQGLGLLDDYHCYALEDPSDAVADQKRREAFLADLNQEISWFEERAARHRQAEEELKAPRAEYGLVAGTPAESVRYQERLERCFERKYNLLMAYRDRRQELGEDGSGLAENDSVAGEAENRSSAPGTQPEATAENGAMSNSEKQN